MRQFAKRAAAFGLALLMTFSAASASEAMGWELHTGEVGLSQGAALGKNLFWSDTYSDLRTEHYVEYTPNEAVLPTVAYGDKVLTRATLSSMAQTLESQGKRVVSGLNGDYYVMSTGEPVSLVVTGGVLRSTPAYTNSMAVGFYADGSAFTGVPNLTVNAVLPTQTMRVTGGVNKVRTLSASDGRGGLVLLTSDFAANTQNTSAGVDVILAPVEGSGGVLTIGGDLPCLVEAVLESTGSIDIPEGKLVLSVNGKDKPELLEALRALAVGDAVTITVRSADERWNSAVEALGSLYQIVSGGQALSGLDAERTARSAIGIKADGTVVFYAIDGKQAGYSVGATLAQVAARLVELGCVEAVCMDGGGSTTLGAAYPGQTGMQVVNRPSDGSQRANSTAIFLTTTLQPTGVLSSYYVTPADSMLLAGASVALAATGLDSGYYPTTGSSQLYYSVTSGGGTVSEDGVYTAGSDSSFAQVTVTDGAAFGTACVTVVKTPDRITLSNEATGAAVSTLLLDPGEQVDLKASAVYKTLPLASDDICYTWTADPEVGTVDANGVFTAADRTARGNLVVSAGGTSAVIPVNVAGHVRALETCEGNLISFASTASAAAAPETALDYVRYGRQSMRVDYDCTANGFAGLATTLVIPSGEKYLSMWVYGDGSGNALLATIADGAGLSGQVLLASLDFTGWQHVSALLPEGAASIRSLDIIYGGAEGRQTGTVWLDHFTTSNEEFHDVTPPVIVLNVNGDTLAASVTDNVDRSTPKESVVVTYDGTPVSFTWNEATGVATVSLPDAGSKYHRVTVTATDASGNLARASASILPNAERDLLYADLASEDRMGELYSAAVYLYDAGVIKGVPAEDGTILFQPGKDITRAEFFTMMARWMDLDLGRYTGVELPFADAAEAPDWALNEIKAMYSLGILQGAAGGDGSLWVNAYATISRAEAMTILGRTYAKGYAQAELGFADADQVPDWALPYVQVLAGQGAVKGGAGDNLGPGVAITREEVANMLYVMD